MNLCMIYVNRFIPIIYYQIKILDRIILVYLSFHTSPITALTHILTLLTYRHFIIQAKGHVTALFSISIIAILFSQCFLFLSYKV